MKCKLLNRIAALLISILLLSPAWFALVQAESLISSNASWQTFPSLFTSNSNASLLTSNTGSAPDGNFAVQIGQLYAFRSDHSTTTPAVTRESGNVAQAGVFLSEFESAGFVPDWFSTQVQSIALVPEPATLALIASGLSFLAIVNRRLRRY